MSSLHWTLACRDCDVIAVGHSYAGVFVAARRHVNKFRKNPHVVDCFDASLNNPHFFPVARTVREKPDFDQAPLF